MLVLAVIANAGTSAARVGISEQRCQYVPVGPPGAPGNELRIVGDASSEVQITRRGRRVRILNASERRVDCSGRRATVTNIDRIVAIYRDEEFSFGPSINLGGGSLAPGATDEGDGSSEIEIDIVGPAETGLHVIGTNEVDEIELGSLDADTTGINLNPGTEAAPDVDVTMPIGRWFGAELYDGNDRLDASGGMTLPGAPAENELFIRSMGGGADELIAGAAESNLVGGTGRDRLVGGSGLDRIGAGPGDDVVLVRGGGRDAVQCGSGDDSVDADSEDVVRLCEDRVP
jgi:hypothetical protein